MREGRSSFRSGFGFVGFGLVLVWWSLVWFFICMVDTIPINNIIRYGTQNNRYLCIVHTGRIEKRV